MKFDNAFLHSKVARRIFMLFVVCALLPIVTLAVLSFSHVTNELYRQSQRRLERGSKGLALSLYERLLLLEAETTTFASMLILGSPDPVQTSFRGLGEDLKQKFKGLAIIGGAAGYKAVLGDIENPPGATPEESQHLDAGKTVISSEPRPSLSARIFMKMMLDSQNPKLGVLVGEIHPQFLWGMGEENELPPVTELIVLDQSNNILVSSLPVPESASREVQARVGRSVSGQFEWTLGGEEFLAGYWSIPLKYRFLVPQWTIVLSESKADVLAPVANFKKMFPLAILLSLCIVLLLSISQIRRSLVPLEKLREGTRRIAQRDFSSQVVVTSGDEFEDLAASFNSMARRLGKQFDALATIAEIDRAILSALDTEKILETVLARIRDVFPCNRVSVTLFDSSGKGAPKSYVREGNRETRITERPIRLSPEEAQSLCDHPEGVLIVSRDSPGPLAPLFGSEIQSLLVFPIFLRQCLFGIVALGYLQTVQHHQDDLVQARQLADQIAVAIHNAQLYEETRNQAIELERANKVKDEFLSIISHELRTPLTAITGYTGLIKDKMLGNINPGQESALEKIMRRSNDLLSMINSILYATSLEANEIKVEKATVNLRHLLDDLKSDYDLSLEKELNLNWDYPADLPAIKTDGAKLKHVLQNLINNAVKFTENGTIDVSARIKEEGSERRSVVFKVADTGIGIPKEKHSLIFQKFCQIDSSETRLYGGVGIGLYIVKNFTEMLGGKVEVESEPGKGSTFTVTIACEQ